MSRKASIVELTTALLRRARPARGHEPGPWPEAIIDEHTDWHAFVAFGSAHFVLAALAEPLTDLARNEAASVPANLLEFMSEIRAANRARNGMLKEHLAKLALAVNAEGIVPLALKGANFLLEDEAGADWRFMSDLDLLVPPESLDAAVEAIRALGFTAVPAPYDASSEAHFPPLISPCRELCVEVHTRLFAHGGFGASPADIVRGAREVSLRGGRLLVPTAIDRIGHVLAHAQMHNRNHAVRRLVLKDVLDLAMLPEAEVTAFAEGRGWKMTDEQNGMMLGLVAAAQRCLGVAPEWRPGPHTRAWADAAIARLSWPLWRQLANLPKDMVALEAHRLSYERGHLARRGRLLLEPRRLASSVSTWTFKQRQRLWS